MSLYAGSLSAATVNVSQDGAINGQNDGGGYGNNNQVLNGGTATHIATWMPGPPGAWQYTRKLFLGFDTSGIDLSAVSAASITVNTGAGSASQNEALGFNAYLVDDLAGGDQFSETTLTWDLATTNGWNQDGNAVDSQRTPGQFIGNVAWAGNDSLMTFNFSAAALTGLQGDTNSFATIVLVPDAPTGGSYLGNDAFASTGPRFLSKESGNGAVLDLTVVPEPSSTALVSIGLIGGLLLRRR